MENKKYSSFNNELDIMNDYIYITPEKQIELGLDEAQLKKFGNYKTQYQQSFAIYIDPAKKTHAATEQIKKGSVPPFVRLFC